MSLSIIPLTQPLYNIYRDFAEIKKKYDEEVYIQSLFVDERIPNQAPSSAVRYLAERYVDNLIQVYNLRVSIELRAGSERKIAIFYYAVGIVILLTVGGGIIYGLVVNLIKESELNDEKKKFYILAKYYIYIYAILIAVVFIIVIITCSLLRKFKAIDKINNIKFYENGSAMFGSILDYCPMFAAKTSKAMLKYDRSSSDSDVQYLSDFRISGKTLSTCNNCKQKKKNKISYTINSELLDNPIVAVIVYVLKKRGLVFTNLDELISKTSDMPFPNISRDVNVLFRDIQHIDIIGQVNRCGDAIAYFKGLLSKSGSGSSGSDSTSSPDERIASRIRALFDSKGVFLNSFIPSRSYPDVLIASDVTDAATCASMCLGQKNASYAVFDNETNTCAVVDTANSKVFPLYYTGNNPTSNKQFEVFTKSGKDIFIASPNMPDNIPNLSREMYKSGFPGTDLEMENACMISSSDGSCIGDIYASNTQVASYVNAFSGISPADAIKRIDKVATASNAKPALFTIRTATDNVISSELTRAPDLIEQKREQFMSYIVDIVKREDPTLSFTFSGAMVSDLSEYAAKAYPELGVQVKGTITDILNEVPARLLAEAASMKTNMIDYRDLKYATGNELENKLKSLSQTEFANTFFTHLYNTYACSQGLSEMQEFYDYTKDDINMSVLTIRVFSVFIILEGLAYVVNFIIKEIPIYKKNIESIEKQYLQQVHNNTQKKANEQNKAIAIRNVRTNLFLKLFLILSVILVIFVVLHVSADRKEQIGMFNYDVMKRNGDILVTQSNSALGVMLGIPTLYAPSPSSKSPDNTLNSNIYLIDNIGPFSSDQPMDLSTIDFNGLRNNLVDIIEAYEKCNALLFGANIEMPFPTYEISIYVFMVIMVIVCASILTFKLEPFKQLKNIRMWRRILANRKRQKYVSQDEINVCGDEDDKLDMDTDLIVKILTVIMIPIATLLFTAQLFNNSTDLRSALYGSNLYRSNICYRI